MRNPFELTQAEFYSNKVCFCSFLGGISMDAGRPSDVPVLSEQELQLTLRLARLARLLAALEHRVASSISRLQLRCAHFARALRRLDRANRLLLAALQESRREHRALERRVAALEARLP